MRWTAMPEATIHKDGKAHTWKRHVYPDGANIRKRDLVVDAEAQAAPVKG